jgi:hypothetical protein
MDDSYPHALRYIDPTDDDPDPIPNIVLRPGDTFTLGAYAAETSVAYVRLLDRHGVCYAILDCERAFPAASNTWLIHTIRSAAP